MKNAQILLLTILLFIITSCTSNSYQELTPKTPDKPTYISNIAPIINSKCISCHASGGQFPELETFTQVKTATENGQVLCRIQQNSCGLRMPLNGSLTQSSIDVIKLWSTTGYTN